MASPRTSLFWARPARDDDREHRDGRRGRQDGEELAASVDEAAKEGRGGPGDDCGQQVGEEVLVPGEDEADQRGRCGTGSDGERYP